MIEKIESYYFNGPQKKYFLLKVAVTIHDGKRTLMHALAIPTDIEIKNLKRMKYDNADYAEYLLKSKDFFNLISQKKDELILKDFIIPYNEQCSVDEYFTPTADADYALKKPYKLFRIRMGSNPYCYSSLSHPDYPSYSNCYDLVNEQMSVKLNPSSSVDFCVLFPIERACIASFKVGLSRFKFQIKGNLNDLICKYNIRTTKEVKRDEFKPKKSNGIKFKGKIIEFGLDLWCGDNKLDCILTRHIDNSKLATTEGYGLLYNNKKNKNKITSIFKRLIMNPWVITIIGGLIVGSLLL